MDRNPRGVPLDLKPWALKVTGYTQKRAKTRGEYQFSLQTCSMGTKKNTAAHTQKLKQKKMETKKWKQKQKNWKQHKEEKEGRKKKKEKERKKIKQKKLDTTPPCSPVVTHRTTNGAN